MNKENKELNSFEELNAEWDRLANEETGEEETEETQEEEAPEETAEEAPEVSEEVPEEVIEEPEQKPNTMEIIYRGEKKELTEDEMKTLAQKGMDYTKKMQEISVHRDLTEAITNDDKLKEIVKNYISGKVTPTEEVIDDNDVVTDVADVKAIVNREVKKEIDSIKDRISTNEKVTLQNQQDSFDKQIKNKLTPEEYSSVQGELENWVGLSSETEVGRIVNSNLTTYTDFIYNIVDRVKSKSKAPANNGVQANSIKATPKKNIQNFIEKPTNVTTPVDNKEVDYWNMDEKKLGKLLRKLK